MATYQHSVCDVWLAVVSNAGPGDQQFLQISFTPATASAFPAVSQSAVLVAPAVGTQPLPVLAAGSQTVLPGSPAWMQVTSLPPVIVKQEKCAVTFSTPSSVSSLTNNRWMKLALTRSTAQSCEILIVMLSN